MKFDYPPKNKNLEEKEKGTYISKGVDIPNKDILMGMSLEKRLPFLLAKAERDFLKYYGKDGERILLALEKEENRSLLITIPRYAMHIPESAYQTSKEVLESRARNLFNKSAYLLETIEELKQYLQNGRSVNDQTKEKIRSYINNLHNRALKLLNSKFNVTQQQNEGTLWYLAQTESIERDLEI